MFLKAGYLTTDSRLPASERNTQVELGLIRCNAIGCERQATRWSCLCARCEGHYLTYNKAIFGKPSREAVATAKDVLRDYLKNDIDEGRFRGWVDRISQAMVRPEYLAISPQRIWDMKNPTERVEHILAWRSKGRFSNGRQAQAKRIGPIGVISLLAYALSMDALITPLLPPPIRAHYMIHLLGMRFMGRKTIVQVKMRYRTRTFETGYVRYTEAGPVKETKRIETEEPEYQFYKIKRHDYKIIGRMLLDNMHDMLIPGGRGGQTWRDLEAELLVRLKGETA